jgi:CPA2 family monovalent cation:H+ antiporter-2
MNESALLITLTSSLAVALVLGFVTRKLGLSPIVGYLLAGLLVGPHTPGFIADRAVADQLPDWESSC